MDRELLEGLLGEGLSLAAIGRRVGRHESTVAYWVAKHGLEAGRREFHAARGGLTRPQLEPLVQQGLSIAEIAEAVDRSKATVRHWLRQHQLKTRNTRGRRRSAGAQAAREQGLTEAMLYCDRHGESSFVLDGRGYYRCRRCRSEAVTRRRRKMKAVLVAEAGGACCVCGYDQTMRGLHFHHVDPAQKRLELNARGVALSLETLRAEARKCVLLCSNCHAAVEDGRLKLPPGSLPAQQDIGPG